LYWRLTIVLAIGDYIGDWRLYWRLATALAMAIALAIGERRLLTEGGRTTSAGRIGNSQSSVPNAIFQSSIANESSIVNRQCNH
jgi:hypothetical protein